MIEVCTGVDNVKVQTGYLYHIKDEFFDRINNKGLMINHENGHSRPTCFTIKDSLEPSNFLFQRIKEDLEILYLLQTKETEYPFL